ncbi:MAG: outer membrane lipoprotein-sorting protein [Deltaproteobacteria bacterium]|nr:outer membrane lipoprotein-sorting protein [Deltaproteobacteria bacterium]
MVKRLENTKPVTFPGGNLRNSNILMTDVRTGHATSMVIKAFRANEGLPDSTFTVRELQWGL